jgi:iron complex transport system ATP-binding protein
MISARNITQRIHHKVLLNNISLDVLPGVFTAVAGPNGAGKSTLLKILSNETSSYGGEVLLNGTEVKKYSIAELSKLRAVLPQSTNLEFPFSVKQIVELGTQYHRNTSIQNSKILNEVMDLTGITVLQDRNYMTLSGGEQQRVQLARVLAQVWEIKSYPRYILLDEPTSNLDIAQQQLIFSLVKEACKRNIGVFAIVHDLNQVAQFADKLYFLRGGNIIAYGKTKEVFTKTNIEETFCCHVNVYHDPCTDCPYIIPDKTKTFFQPSLKTVNL